MGISEERSGSRVAGDGEAAETGVARGIGQARTGGDHGDARERLAQGFRQSAQQRLQCLAAAQRQQHMGGIRQCGAQFFQRGGRRRKRQARIHVRAQHLGAARAQRRCQHAAAAAAGDQADPAAADLGQFRHRQQAFAVHPRGRACVDAVPAQGAAVATA